MAALCLVLMFSRLFAMIVGLCARAMLKACTVVIGNVIKEVMTQVLLATGELEQYLLDVLVAHFQVPFQEVQAASLLLPPSPSPAVPAQTAATPTSLPTRPVDVLTIILLLALPAVVWRRASTGGGGGGGGQQPGG